MCRAILLLIGSLALLGCNDPGASGRSNGDGLLEGREAYLAASAIRPKLETAALAACRCEQRGDTPEECWREYEAMTSAFEDGGMTSACAPISEEYDCFGEEDGQSFCLPKRYRYVGLGSHTLCTEEEAQLVAGAWASEYERTQDHSAANAAGAAAATQIAEGRYTESAKQSTC